MKLTTKEMILASLFAALMVVSARLSASFGNVIPLSMQPMFAILAGILVGSKIALVSNIVYILMGLVGLPVFTRGGGITYVLQPSFGYILGFAAAAYVSGYIIERLVNLKRDGFGMKLIKYLFASLTGLAVIYVFGVLYWYVLWNVFVNKPIELVSVIKMGVVTFLLKDVITSIVVSIIGERIGSRVLNIVQR